MLAHAINMFGSIVALHENDAYAIAASICVHPSKSFGVKVSDGILLKQCMQRHGSICKDPYELTKIRQKAQKKYRRPFDHEGPGSPRWW